MALFDPTLKKTPVYMTKEGDQPVSAKFRNYLNKNYPGAWGSEVGGRKPPEVVLVGFNLRPFLKILGIECSLPASDKACPLRLWYDNTDHRDIAEAILPRECKGLTLPYVLKYRRPADPTAATRWDELVDGWTGPGVKPATDSLLAFVLAGQLGMLA